MKLCFSVFLACAGFFSSLYAQQNPDATYRKDVAEVRAQLIKLSACNSIYNEMGLMAVYGSCLAGAEIIFQKDISNKISEHENYKLALTKIQNHIQRYGSTWNKFADEIEVLIDKVMTIPNYEQTKEGLALRARIGNYLQANIKTEQALITDLTTIQKELEADLDKLSVKEQKKFKLLTKGIEDIKILKSRAQHVDILNKIKTIKINEFSDLLRKLKISHYKVMGGMFLLGLVWSLAIDYATDADWFGGIMLEDIALRDVGPEQMNDFAQDLVKLHGKDPALKMINDRLRQAGCWE